MNGFGAHQMLTTVVCQPRIFICFKRNSFLIFVNVAQNTILTNIQCKCYTKCPFVLQK